MSEASGETGDSALTVRWQDVLGPRRTIQSIIPKLLNPSFGLRVLLRMIVRNKQRKGSAPCELAEKKSLKIVST